MNVSAAKLKSMSVDKLTVLRAQVSAALSFKVAEERRSVQEQLSRLDRLATTGIRAKDAGHSGRRAPVMPKYRNPANPEETWAGRGLKPRWLVVAMKSGKKLEHFAIAAQRKSPVKRGPVKRKKARA
jgi:DNA-binding protein H-NS